MFENKIIFETFDPIFSDKSIRPEPSAINIPEWYKKLKNYHGDPSLSLRTIKLCMPFLDAISAGYVLKNQQEIVVNQQVVNPNHKEEGESMWLGINPEVETSFIHKDLPFPMTGGIRHTHNIDQLGGKEGGCPYIKKNHNEAFLKLINPWLIKVPKGYSVLFLPVINKLDSKFTPLAGIVDCDTFNMPVNFPCVVHHKGTFTIEKGEPLVTAIPFKRESWKAIFKKGDVKKWNQAQWNYTSFFQGQYKRFFRRKKSWK
jgi:hypothetical protein